MSATRRPYVRPSGGGRPSPQSLQPRRRAIRALAVALFVAGAAHAGELRGPASWNQRIAETETHLRQGEYRQALRVAEPLAAEVAQGIGTGEAAERAVGTVVSLVALAEAGTGGAEAALWHWRVARAFRPDLEGADLAGYGVAGELLAARLAAEREEKAAIERGEKPAPLELGPQRAPDVEPPRKRRAPDPQVTAAFQEAKAVDFEILLVVIDDTGGSPRPWC